MLRSSDYFDSKYISVNIADFSKGLRIPMKVICTLLLIVPTVTVLILYSQQENKIPKSQSHFSV